MNIGQKINEFDNSTGTVQDFNKIFPHSPLEAVSGNLEIGDIVGVGRQYERNMRLYTTDMEGNQEVIEFTKDLSQVTTEVKPENLTKEQRLKGAAHVLIARDIYGDVIAKETTAARLGKLLGVSDYTVIKKLHNNYDMSRCKHKFTVEKIKK